MPYVTLLMITWLSAIISACVNMVITYKYLLNTEHGFEYGILIACQIISVACFSPVLERYISRFARPAKFFLIFGLVSALLNILVIQGQEFLTFSIYIFFTTLTQTLNAALFYKLLPRLFKEDKVKLFNIWSEQALSTSFFLSALLVPFAFFFTQTAELFFILSAFINFSCGSIFYIIFRKVTVETILHKSINSWQNYINILTEKKLRHFFFTSNIYLFAFSATAFALAMIAKEVGGGNIYLYSYPIIAMFAGRIIALLVLKRLLSWDISFLFIVGCVISAIFMAPLGGINNIYLLCCLEFFLGIGLAIAKYSEKSYYQLEHLDTDLAKVSILRSASALINKSLSIPFVLAIAYYDKLIFISITLAFCYLISAIIMVKYKLRY
ncbi:MFS transporter [Bartonella sp. DGB1]|uniref:MFS transporter n=1 Tax=Bartonella sp. DGB1 TaxID=3239807 RepID=UPI003524DB5C